MHRILISPILVLTFISCSTPHANPRVEIQTSFGDVVVELFASKAPKSVSAFLSYVDSGFYKNSTFYRVLNNENQPSDAFKSEIIQGGLWGLGRNKKMAGIPHEPTNQTHVSHTDGTISLRRK